jgi:16S rRNA G966 N2-methylase RsmD
MCDKSQEAIKYIKENLNRTHLGANAIVSNKDYAKFLKELKNQNIKFDIIFLDPPYELDISKDAVKLILDYELLNQDGIIIIETDEKKRDEENLSKLNVDIYDSRKYGRANLIFLVERG